MEIIKVKEALSKLIEMNLPIKVKLDIALISNAIDKQVKAYNIVRDSLFREYSIKPGQGKEEGSVTFECTLKGEDEAGTDKLHGDNLRVFSQKFNELLDTETGDMVFEKIRLPCEIDGKPLQIKFEDLKVLAEFVEIE